MNEYIGRVKELLEKKNLVVIATECEVWYHGKVESYLPQGDRVIVIKQDRVLLVHQPSGVNPINYMKENTEHNIVENSEGIFLKSKNTLLKDYMEIKFHRIYFVSSFLLEDSKDIIVSGSEKDMSDMIYYNPYLIEDGFKPFSREEHTRFGFIDVFGTDANGKIVVIECKRDFADFKAISQLHRYIHKLVKSKGIPESSVRGIIAAPRISDNALMMLKEYGYEFKSINPPKYLEKYDSNQKRLFEY
ncbi:MAG: endonuclease NucS [Candidatus Woesearchaeota archaeon]|nr:MAG: endonuclease NucS [Candidatus Woesearchaeota archaeon]